MIKVKCISPMAAWWGEVLVVGEEYTLFEIKNILTEIITDYDNYWKYTSMIAGSIEWIRKGYTQEQLPEVIPGYLDMKEVHKRYAKKVDMPFGSVKCSDTQINSFCLLTDDEVYELGAVMNKDGNGKGRPGFNYTVYMIDDYFDYVQTRRDKKLNELGINIK